MRTQRFFTATSDFSVRRTCVSLVLSKPESPVISPRPEIRRIERLAWETSELCRNDDGLTETPLPVPVDRWIEKPLGIRFSITDLSYVGQDVLGAAFIEGNEIAVSDRTLSHEGRFRFTCAHELGHFVLHRKLAARFQDATAEPEELVGIERQANSFAAAFLMPRHLLFPELARACSECQLALQPTLFELLRHTPESERLWRYTVIPFLAGRFGVSRTALIYRFSDLRMMDRRPFLLPSMAARLQTPVGAVFR